MTHACWLDLELDSGEDASLLIEYEYEPGAPARLSPYPGTPPEGEYLALVAIREEVEDLGVMRGIDLSPAEASRLHGLVLDEARQQFADALEDAELDRAEIRAREREES